MGPIIVQVMSCSDGTLSLASDTCTLDSKVVDGLPSLKLTFLLGRPIFRGHVSFREGICARV